MDYALLCLGLIGFAVFMYVILDGLTLGVGILSPWLYKREHKALAMYSLTHVWDANQTWLVFGGVLLYVGFPEAYGAVLSQLYLPVMLMLLALIFRGVAFEFRFKANERQQRWWDYSFSFGSLLAAISQGIILGSLVQAAQVPNNESRVHLNEFTLFTLLTGVSVACGYALLGACWLIRKSEGALNIRSRVLGQYMLIAVVTGLSIISLWMLVDQAYVRNRWLTWPGSLWLMPIPLLCIACSLTLWQQFKRSKIGNLKPLFLSMCLFILAFIGLVVGMFPYIVPGQLTIWQAVAPEKSLEFALVGILIFLPIILIYTGFNYWLFRGQVHAPSDIKLKQP